MKKSHFIVFLLLLLGDQLSKWVVTLQLALGESVLVIPGFFDITYLENKGAAWSMLEGKMVFFILVAIVALVFMFYCYRRSEDGDVFIHYGLVLMMAGTIGNLIDRVWLGYVRDFLSFDIFGYAFPVFNIADVALCVGVFLVIVSVLLEEYCGGANTCEK